MSLFPRLMTAALALALCTALASPAAAQTTANASILATATVSGGFAALTATGTQNLEFGTIDAGTCVAGCAPVNNGRFEITGEPSAPVTVSFTSLPSVLDGQGPAAGSTLGVAFGVTDGSRLTTGTTTIAETFDPAAAKITALDAGGDLWIGIAGTVTTELTSTNGDYQGTIQLTVSYL
jgi:hypothetical protein